VFTTWSGLGDAGGELLADQVEEGEGRKHLAMGSEGRGIRRVLEDRSNRLYSSWILSESPPNT
jgi:hypothetical protein